MRFLPLISIVSASSVLENTESLTGFRTICDSNNHGVSNHNTSVIDQVTLNGGESCIYRLLGGANEIMEVLEARLEFSCDEGQMWLYADGEEFGPFCNENRHRRGSYDYNMGGMNGKSFKSDEVDMVFKNGQGFKFSFSFSFQFEFLPGLPGQATMCSYKPIQESNEIFAKSADGNSAAVALWVKLTASLYKFNCNYGQYSDQCTGFSPVRVSCNTLDWHASCEQMTVQLMAIINAQCSQCSSDGICANWREMFDQLKAAIDGETASSGGYNYPVAPKCDEDQCANGYNDCSSDATCTDECDGYTCKCNKGYSGDGKKCTKDCDKDQCANGYNDCDEKATCTNECQGYSCECNTGYSGDGKKCTKDCDENQCQTGNNECSEHATCTNKCEGYSCKCKKGYNGDGKNCKKDCDADQCASGYNECSVHATCTNECQGYKCECKKGYSGSGKQCTKDCDENQCDANKSPCPEHATCTNKCEGFECKCVPGYSMVGDVCVKDCDENQCENKNACPEYATCTNLCEGHKCACIDGYHMENGKCIKDCDPEACSGKVNPCGDYSICVEKCYGHECKCITGYHMENGVCVKDCDANQCNANPCQPRATCDDKCQGYECKCNKHFFLTGDECCDKNQCDQNPCPKYSSCTNLCVGFKCDCDEGYHKEKGKCVPDCDADQCKNGTANCPKYSQCKNKCDGFECICDDGFTMQDGACCDVNQCALGGAYGSPVCPPHSTCVNECDGYRCPCDEGYKKEGGKCVPICDENQCDTNPCPAYSSCHDECDGFKCKCFDGYTFNANTGKCDKDCDAKQCTSGSYGKSPCGKNMICEELCEGYECKCKKNYIPDGNDGCKHEDPCHNVKCGAYKQCKNGECMCVNGYYMDDSGKCIEKVNECITGDHDCDVYATCTDTLTGYTCECNENYKDVSTDYNGRKCVHPYYTETGECNLHEYSAFTDKKFEGMAYTSAYNYHDAIAAWKAVTAELSRLGEVSKQARGAECSEDAGIIGCLWIDYTKDETACAWAHTLETVVQKVSEKCNPEWDIKFAAYLETLRKATCEEPDDCKSGNHNCDENATCTPKKPVYGSPTSGFRCQCKKGYYGNGKSCYLEINECADGIHKCHEYAKCTDTQGGYKCACTNGYVGNGYKCDIPVDECKEQTHDCDYHAKCYDLPNGYLCKCDATQGYHGNGKECDGPADECYEGTHTCHADATCTNTYAGFTCKCPEGWFGDGKKCWPPLTCPWKNDDYANYEGDFDNGLCSLKYIKVCTKTLYADLTAAGVEFCQGSYAQQQFTIFLNEMFTFGKIYEKKYGIATSHLNGDSYNRYGAECSPEAGAVPCNLINFHNVLSAEDLFERVNKLFDHVFGQCAPTYRAKWEQWLARYHNALICPINECKTGEAKCHENGYCVDMAMGYDCVCKKHYYGDGFTSCEPIDYCSVSNVCPMFSTCSSKNPGYECICNEGYYKQGNKCAPVDPCKKNNGGCDEHARCSSQLQGNTYNHFCKCFAGYYGNGFQCDPIQPCAQNNCDDNAQCKPYNNIVTEADYNCVCNVGYEGNGFICNKIVDPCEEKVCGENARTKIITSYGMKSCICECNHGYTGDGINCRPINPCTGNDCHPHADCKPNAGGGYTCVCHAHHGYTGNGKNCQKVDPCDNCHQHATCGAYDKVCKCKNGYIGDGFVCRPPNSCPRPCPSGTRCDDGLCMCSKPGYAYEFGEGYYGGGGQCKDINECERDNNCSENAICTNTDGGFRCQCKNGYVGDGVTCNKQQQGGAYDQSGNPYAGGGNNVAEPTRNPNPSGIDISIYSELSAGECSVMGFDWENLSKIMDKMHWVTYNKNMQIDYVNQIFQQFAHLGKSALARNPAQCDAKKAGVVPCKYLYFPHKEHRCQLVKRMARIFADVAGHCNAAWKNKYGGMMNYILQNNQSGKHGAACEKINWL